MDEAEVTYDAHGPLVVSVAGRDVPVKELVDAWMRRGESRQYAKVIERLMGERDAANTRGEQAREAFDVVVKSHADTSAKLRGERDSYRDEPRRVREEAVGHKRLWLVSRRDKAGLPGEHGDVVVWAESQDDAADVVLTAGYKGRQPLYGYRDKDGLTVIPLSWVSRKSTDARVVVAETLR